MAGLATRWPGQAEVEYWLGACEAALGHVDAALEAWGRVPRGSEFGPKAMLDRGRLALEHGRLSVAEESVAPLLLDMGEIGAQAVRVADQVDLYTGRRAAIVRRIERRWSLSRDQAGLLRLSWQLGSEPVAVLPVGQALERMAREAPGDDRVWLGLADLARARGEYEAAGSLLSRWRGEEAGRS